MAAVPAALAKGQNPWSAEERQLAYDLSQEPYFREGSRVSAIKIAQALNGLYHAGNEIRLGRTVTYFLRRHKRSLESK